MNVTDARSRFVWIVSEPSNTPFSPAPALQYMTALPGKCPPSWTSVTPGRTSTLPFHERIAGAGRETHSRLGSATSTGTLPNAQLHSTRTPNMCGWLATIATTSPNSRTRRMAWSSRYPVGSQSRLPAGVRTRCACWPMPTLGSTVIPNRSGSSSRTCVWCPAAASSSRVVHRCPASGTHCRSSAQMAHSSTASACSTAQVWQIRTFVLLPRPEVAVLVVGFVLCSYASARPLVSRVESYPAPFARQRGPLLAVDHQDRAGGAAGQLHRNAAHEREGMSTCAHLWNWLVKITARQRKRKNAPNR